MSTIKAKPLKPLTRQRLRLSLAAAIGLLCLWLSFYQQNFYFSAAYNNANKAPNTEQDIAIAHFNNIKSLSFDEQGRLQGITESPKITQYKSGRAIIEAPNILFFEAESSNPQAQSQTASFWHISAGYASSNENQDLLQLSESVQIQQRSFPVNTQDTAYIQGINSYQALNPSYPNLIQFNTEQLRLMPDKKLAETDTLVNIQQAQHHMHAKGMKLNLNNSILELKQQVKTHYAAP